MESVTRPTDAVARFRRDSTLTTADPSTAVTPVEATDFHHGAPQGGEGWTIVVRDSGIDTTHPVFDGIDVRQPDIDGLPTDGEDTVGHGTGTAGLAVLLCPHVEAVYDVPIFGDSGRTDLATIRRSYEYITHEGPWVNDDGTIGKVAVNDSWGARRTIRRIDQWHNEMEQAGAQSVVAAGNTDRTTGSPATAARAYSVAGCTLDGRMTGFSSPTDDITLLARNIAIPKSKDANMGRPIPEDEFDRVMSGIGGEWNYASGTSFAAPRGLSYGVAYQTQVVPELTPVVEPDESMPFERLFNKTAEDIKGTDEDGQGYLNYHAAVEAAPDEPGGKDPPIPIDATVWGINVPPFDGNEFIRVQSDESILDSGNYQTTADDLTEAFEKADGG